MPNCSKIVCVEAEKKWPKVVAKRLVLLSGFFLGVKISLDGLVETVFFLFYERKNLISLKRLYCVIIVNIFSTYCLWYFHGYFILVFISWVFSLCICCSLAYSNIDNTLTKYYCQGCPVWGGWGGTQSEFFGVLCAHLLIIILSFQLEANVGYIVILFNGFV